MPGTDTVLVLGGGINGCALARELVLNGTNVWLVDTADLSAGATSASSRLIHGGLRYLEYGDFELVKESLAERTKLLSLAPQFVRPLELYIPAATRFGGAIGAVGRFFGWKWWPTPQPRHGRGSWLICSGLQMYDVYSRDSTLPKHRLLNVSAPDAPPVDPHRYHWLCAYYDAQVVFPERLVLSMLADARQLAEEQQLDFRVLNYHRATLDGRVVRISAETGGAGTELTLEPGAIVNATGAWVDATLQKLAVPSRRLMGGTKGTHFLTFNTKLRAALGDKGIYAEAPDGRPVFILPLADAVLVGTTDEKYEGPPEQAAATEAELDYLLSAVDTVVPAARLTRQDIAFHYSAVRPLPYSDASTPAAISRRHAVVRHDDATLPVFSLVGGKLTTMRSFAQAAAADVLASIGRKVETTSEHRPFPGSTDYPNGQSARSACIELIAARCQVAPPTAAAAFALLGTQTDAMFSASSDRAALPGVRLPEAMARWSIRREWATNLADLVERRLMLLYDPSLSRDCLRRLAEMLVEEGRLPSAEVDSAVQRQVSRLADHFGRRI